MSFSNGQRVVLKKSHAGVAVGSLGTVENGTAVTAIVDFDVSSGTSVMVPNIWLRLASAGVGEVRQSPYTGKGAQSPMHRKEDGSSHVTWFPPTVITPGVGTAANFVAVTATPNVLSLLLQGAEVALRGRTTSGCWIGSLEFPVEGGPSKLNVDLRGFAEQPKGSHTSIFVVIGAVLKSIAFDDEKSGNFTETFAATIGAEPVQTITIIILAERPADSEDLLIGVDSLDIT